MGVRFPLSAHEGGHMAVKIVRGYYECSIHGEIQEDVLYVDYEDGTYRVFCLKCISDLLEKNIPGKLTKM